VLFPSLRELSIDFGSFQGIFDKKLRLVSLSMGIDDFPFDRCVAPIRAEIGYVREATALRMMRHWSDVDVVVSMGCLQDLTQRVFSTPSTIRWCVEPWSSQFTADSRDVWNLMERLANRKAIGITIAFSVDSFPEDPVSVSVFAPGARFEGGSSRVFLTQETFAFLQHNVRFKTVQCIGDTRWIYSDLRLVVKSMTGGQAEISLKPVVPAVVPSGVHRPGPAWKLVHGCTQSFFRQ
jgi:hypothetical protein